MLFTDVKSKDTSSRRQKSYIAPVEFYNKQYVLRPDFNVVKKSRPGSQPRSDDYIGQ